MFFYARKVCYLDRREGGEKENIGFMILQSEKNGLHCEITIKGKLKNGRYICCLNTAEKNMSFGGVDVKEGQGCLKVWFPFRTDALFMEKERFLAEEIRGVEIRDEKNHLAASGFLTTTTRPAETVPEAANEATEMRPTRKLQEAAGEAAETQPTEVSLKAANEATEMRPTETLPEAAGEAVEIQPTETPPKAEEQILAEPVCADKWQELKRQYQVVHPFGDEREFITIRIRDFIILRDEYQKLAHNSFLLHGFYNYGHLILGKDTGIQKEEGEQFYLGVPGVYFEREKMVAVMFGFEGYETKGAVEPGKQGYYLRKVKI